MIADAPAWAVAAGWGAAAAAVAAVAGLIGWVWARLFCRRDPLDNDDESDPPAAGRR